MTEQKIDIKKNMGKNGKEYSNLDLKTIEDGNYIIVEKMFPEGLKVEGKFGPVYSIGVKYNDELCSFWLNPKQNTAYKECGEVGDKIKVTAREEKIINPKTKVKMLVMRYYFEKV